MAVQRMTLKIDADVSGIKSGAEQAKAAIADLNAAVQRLATALGTMGNGAAEGLSQGAGGANANQQQTGAAQAALADQTAAKAQAIQAEMDLEQTSADRKAALTAQLSALWASYQTQRDQLNQQAAAAIAAADQAAAKKSAAAWDKALSPVVRSFTSGLLKMAEGSRSFHQVVVGLGDQILDGWSGNVDKMVTKWAAGQLAQVGATQAGQTAVNAAKTSGAAQGLAIEGAAAASSIMNQAAAAAAAAYQAMAGVPLVGPALGAAAAATVFAAVLAFRGMVASAAGGWGEVPFDNAPALLHRGEMVLPASIAAPLRANLAAGSTASAAQGGDVHLHVQALDGASVAKLFRGNGEAITQALRAQHRAGAFAGV